MLSLNYEIFGNDLPYVQVTLAPSTEAMAEQGAMMYVDQHIVMSVVLGDGSASKFGVIGRFFNAIKRTFTGESMFSIPMQGLYRKTSRLQRQALAK